MQVPNQVPIPNVHNFKNIKNQQFERLKVLYYAGKIKEKPSWVCRCSCGTIVVVVSKQLFRKQTKSCGCLMKTINIKHGYKGTKIYRIWCGMKNRCLNPNSKDYTRYGGRGISICSRWKSFELFLEDMKEPPQGDYTIERIDNERNYTKSNCKWITRQQQATNRRDNIRITINGVTLVASEWDREQNFSIGTVSRRITRSGWSHEDAVKTPIDKRFSRDQKHSSLKRNYHSP